MNEETRFLAAVLRDLAAVHRRHPRRLGRAGRRNKRR